MSGERGKSAKKRPSIVCSTPFLSPSKKRISFMKSPVTLKRSESVLSLDTESLLEVNEDEVEKKAHRRSLALQSFQNTPATLMSPSRVKSKLVTPRGPRLDPEQIKQHYADCIKLSTENKINAKNAFGLHLLEYIGSILEEKSDNFQVVGCTIDAGAKIYAGRVDSVHSDILKMLGSMGQAGGDEDGPDSDAGEDPEEASQAKKKEKKKKTITLTEGRTIEKNINNIRISSYDLSFDVDPMVKLAARQSDEQSTAALITYNVPLVRDLLQYDSSSVLLRQSDEVEQLTDIPRVDYAPAHSSIPWLTSDHVICPTFDEFRFNNWNCDDDKSFYEPSAEPVEALDSQDTVPEPFVPGLEDLQDEEDYNDDIGGGGISSDEETKEHAARQAAQKMTIDDLTLALEPTEYGYFNQRLAQMWAGPGLWKIKKVENKTTADGQKKEKKKKVNVTHMFETPAELLDKEFLRSRAKIVLAQTTLQSNKNSTNTLPQDIHYMESSLRRLSMRPLWKGKLKPAAVMCSQESNARDNWYDYGNQHDNSNYCPNTADDEDDDHHSFGLPEEEVSFTTPAAGLSLIEPARRIEKININYARQAKKIDVKKLKSVMWKNLAPPSENIENVKPDLVTEDKPSKQQDFTFADLYKVLPNQISHNMAENLSVPIAFACLLHLANEHNLELRDAKDLKDISIITTDCT